MDRSLVAIMHKGVRQQQHRLSMPQGRVATLEQATSSTPITIQNQSRIQWEQAETIREQRQFK